MSSSRNNGEARLIRCCYVGGQLLRHKSSELLTALAQQEGVDAIANDAKALAHEGSGDDFGHQAIVGARFVDEGLGSVRMTSCSPQDARKEHSAQVFSGGDLLWGFPQPTELRASLVLSYVRVKQKKLLRR